MTAISEAPQQERRLFGLLPPKPEPVRLLSGHYVHFRTEQMIGWGVVVGLLGACFFAGLYFGLWEVNWHIFYLKPWWDAGSFWPRWLGHWVVYRHAAFRDLAEPEGFIMFLGILLAKPSHWNDRCSTFRLIVSPVILVVLAAVLNVAGVWLLNFGLPAPAVSFFASYSLGTLILGFAIGHFVLRPFWAPVGALLQGNAIDQAVVFYRRWGRTPVWEKLPVSPPVVRERFAARYRKGVSAVQVSRTASRWHKLAARSMPYVLSFVTLVIVLLTVLGGMAKYGFAHGWHVPFLYPAS